MNGRDRSAIIFVTITIIFLVGLKSNQKFLNEYQSLAYPARQTSPTFPTYVTGYASPSVSQQVLDILETKTVPEIPLVFDNLLDTEELTNSSVKDGVHWLPAF